MTTTETYFLEKIKSSFNDEAMLRGIIDDIKNEENLKTLDRFFELSIDLICIAGTDGYFKKISRSFERVLGYSEKELLNNPYINYVIEDDQSKTDIALDVLKEGSPILHFENRYRCKDGSIKWLSWRSISVLEDNLIYAIARDVTEEKNEELALKNYSEQLEVSNHENTQSLDYAKLLQEAMMPHKESLSFFFTESFIFLSPKNIVSGDFFWFDKSEDKVLIAAGDCTGHGVPGALLTVMGINILNSALYAYNIDTPQLLMKKIDITIDAILRDEDGKKTMNDGMDIVICSIDKENMVLEFSAINNPLYLVRNDILIEYKPERYLIGSNTAHLPFTQTTVNLVEGDMIYLFSDGFPDQFGGAINKKFGYPKFRTFLTSIANLDAKQQLALIEQEIQKWGGNHEQTDDILVIGFRI